LFVTGAVLHCGVPKTRIVKCPTCKKAGDWFAGPVGPFCSPRCKLIDLGKWLGEENAISEPLAPDDLRKEVTDETDELS